MNCTIDPQLKRHRLTKTVLTAIFTFTTVNAWSRAAEGPFQEVVLKSYLDGEFASDLVFQPGGNLAKAEERVTIGGVPFTLAKDEKGRWRSVDVAASRWREMEKEPLRITDPLWVHSSAEKGDLVLHLPKAVYGDPEKVGDWEQHATAFP